MKRAFILFFAVVVFHFSGCAARQHPTYVAPRPELKRITQLDLDTNLPLKSWDARADTVHQHVTPPVGISFVEAETGKKIQFDGTYKIESYRQPGQPNESRVRDAHPQSTPQNR